MDKGKRGAPAPHRAIKGQTATVWPLPYLHTSVSNRQSFRATFHKNVESCVTNHDQSSQKMIDGVQLPQQ